MYIPLQPYLNISLSLQLSHTVDQDISVSLSANESRLHNDDTTSEINMADVAQTPLTLLSPLPDFKAMFDQVLLWGDFDSVSYLNSLNAVYTEVAQWRKYFLKVP